MQTKIHVEVWLAGAVLHEAGLSTYSAAQLAAEISEKFQDSRPGVKNAHQCSLQCLVAKI